MTFFQFAKKKSWFKKVNKDKTTSKQSDHVTINIGVLAWSERSSAVKPIRGKRICLRTSKDSDYETIRTNGIKRLRDFNPEIININKDYLLAFESGEIALNIPGTFEKFCLSKYRDELGKEYKNITLFLISQSDKFILEKIKSNPFTQELDEYESPCEIDLDAVNQNTVSPAAAEIADDLIIIDPMESPPCKQAKRSDTPVDEDAIYAQSLQAFFNEEGLLPNLTESEIDQVLPSSFDSIIDDLRKHVCQDEQFFLNVRRNADLMRILSL